MSYQPGFIAGFEIPLPLLTQEYKDELYEKHDVNIDDYHLDYEHFSLILHPLRGFPFYTAANINGLLFKQLTRNSLFGGSDRWRKDTRIPYEHQHGSELYSAPMSDFDRGHITKREDVQWAQSEEMAKEAAKSTFHYTNAVPQMAKLNRGIWKDIENYILHDESIDNDLSITLFSGPVLNEDDPIFISEVRNNKIRLPYLFWKLVYYKKQGKLFRTAFMASQRNLLEQKGIIEGIIRSDDNEKEILFQRFKDAETYQIQVGTIEELTGMSFHPAEESYLDDRPTRLILDDVDVRDLEDVPKQLLNLII